MDEEASSVHEIQERLISHPRGDRAVAEARGGAADRMDRRSAAKVVTDPAPSGQWSTSRATFVSRRSPWASRATYSARPFDGWDRRVR
jgi:hypothetical protein